MSALAYLMLTRLKNSLKEFIKTPSKLILGVFMVLVLGFTIFSGHMGQAETETFRDINELYAIVFALYLFIAVIGAAAGLNNGASFFTMPDVTLVFPAPFSTKRVLVYGLLRQMGMTVLMAVFLLFQYSWMSMTYNVNYGGLLVIILGYVLVVFSSQLAAMGIYAFCAGSDKRKRIVKFCLYGLVAVVVAAALYPMLTAQDKLGAVVGQVTALPFSATPLAGWMMRFVMGLMEGNILYIALGLGATLLFIGLFLIVVLKTDADYYEDVLVATEVSHSAITAKKEGRMPETTPQNIKVGKVGLNAGQGASVFYYKSRVEDRRSRIFLFDLFTLINIAAAAIFAFMMRELNGFISGFAFSVYIMLFTSMGARWAKELSLPYIYMVPQDSFKKLTALIASQVIKTAVESAAVVVTIGLITSAGPADIFFFALLRFGAGLMIIACNILIERVFGTMPKWLQLTLYFLFLIILLIPAIIAAVVLGVLGQLYAGLLIAFVWELLVTFIVLFLCRNILNNAEMNNR